MEHGPYHIPNGPMRAFNRAILMGMPRSHVFDVVPCFLEECKYLCTFAKITTKVKAYVFDLNLTWWIILGEPHIEKLHRQCLAGKAFPM